MYQYNLKIGNLVFGVRFTDFSHFQWFTEYFKNESRKAFTDIIVDIKISRPSDVSFIPDSFFQSKRLSRNTFKMEGRLLRGKYSSRRKHVKLILHPVMIETDASRVFEQCFYQLYYTVLGDACKTYPLIHSSGVIKDSKGFLFLGPSEAGKSTVAELSSNYTVINDEITIVDISSKIPMLRSTPFNGLFHDKSPGAAPLFGIFVLEKSQNDYIQLLEQSSAIRPVADQIIPPVSILEEMKSDVYFKQLDIVNLINKRVPIYKLYFTKSEMFWNEIDKLVKIKCQGCI